MSATAVRTGPLRPQHRSRIEQILLSTGVFRSEEIGVALELFDDALPTELVPACGSSDARAESETQPESIRAVRSTQYTSTVPLPSPSSSYVFLGAFTPDDELVGFACYGPTPGTDRTWDLYWIAVHQTAQGTGSGTILLSEVERRLEDTDARMFVVETSSRSEYEPTRAFYRARGYAEAARMRDFYAPSDDRIILTKRFHHPHRGREQSHDE